MKQTTRISAVETALPELDAAAQTTHTKRKSRTGIMKVRTLDESISSINDLRKTEPARSSSVGTSCTDDSSALTNLDNAVSFDRLQIRTYCRAVGDNPCVRNGAPVSLGWKYNIGPSMSVDEYEQTRPLRRQGPQMVMPRLERERVLLDHGFSRADLRDAVRSVTATKKKRLQTVNNLKMAKAEEMFENAKRGITGVFRSKKKENQKLWEKEAQRANAFIQAENEAAGK
mmetsp:Transcript_25246/g.39084  ORF Transcript_25246/g.39084 Transcript_25246/m.39084 type:complete len:229 (+) Transcript_25246:3-689(+)